MGNLLLIIIIMVNIINPQFHSLTDLQAIDNDASCKQALFVWHLDDLTDETLESIIEDGYDTLYIYYSSKREEIFESKLDLCSSYNFSVYALNGSYEWIDYPERLDDFFKGIGKYLNDYPDNFQGVVLDIEPYVMKDRDEIEDYEAFQSLLIRAKDYTDDLGLKLNVVVPFWYEKIHTPEMSDDDNLAYWIMRLADETTIMAYRNEIAGKNGILSLISEEVKYSLLSDENLVIALETKPSREGDHISFDQFSQGHVKTIINELKTHLNDDNFSYAIHDLKSWLELDGVN